MTLCACLWAAAHHAHRPLRRHQLHVPRVRSAALPPRCLTHAAAPKLQPHLSRPSPPHPNPRPTAGWIFSRASFPPSDRYLNPTSCLHRLYKSFAFPLGPPHLKCVTAGPAKGTRLGSQTRLAAQKPHLRCYSRSSKRERQRLGCPGCLPSHNQYLRTVSPRRPD